MYVILLELSIYEVKSEENISLGVNHCVTCAGRESKMCPNGAVSSLKTH